MLRRDTEPTDAAIARVYGAALAVAVTKYSGLDEAGAAACLGLSPSELRRRLVRGLTAIRPEPACV